MGTESETDKFRHDEDTLDDYYVIAMPDGRNHVTRSRVRVLTSWGQMMRDGVRPLTRADIYRGRFEQAQCEYAHAFMCSGFPMGPDPDRPSREQWMSQPPFDFEVDEFLSEKLFPADCGEKDNLWARNLDSTSYASDASIASCPTQPRPRTTVRTESGGTATRKSGASKGAPDANSGGSGSETTQPKTLSGNNGKDDNMDKNARGETGVTAEQARKITESCAPRVDRELYGQACREIRSAAQVGKRSCLLPIEYGYAQQDALAKRLTDDGFKVDWITGHNSSMDDDALDACALMKIRW